MTGVYSIDKRKGISRAEAILEYCREPRTGREIIKFLGLEYRQYSRTRYIKPLLEIGKLKLMLPQNQANRNQRFVNAEVEIAIPTEAAIIEYCKIPRRKKEIREHFGLKIFQVKSHVDPLIADGRLKGTEPNNPQNYWQRYVSAEYGAPVSLNELILEFCKEPRTRKEIAERTGIDIGKMKSYTQPLVDCGKLKMTNQASPTSPRQRFAAADSNTVILTEETLIELCATPKSRIEIMEHFGYNSVAGMKAFISPLIKSRKLAYLHPEMPMCRWQKYVKAQ